VNKEMAVANVLIIEDEDNIVTALGFLLTRGGHNHSRLTTGSGAVGLIR